MLYLWHIIKAVIKQYTIKNGHGLIESQAFKIYSKYMSKQMFQKKQQKYIYAH